MKIDVYWLKPSERCLLSKTLLIERESLSKDLLAKAINLFPPFPIAQSNIDKEVRKLPRAGFECYLQKSERNVNIEEIVHSFRATWCKLYSFDRITQVLTLFKLRWCSSIGRPHMLVCQPVLHGLILTNPKSKSKSRSRLTTGFSLKSGFPTSQPPPPTWESFKEAR